LDEWGTINLPFSSKYCQHGFPVRHFTEYQCFNDSYYTIKDYKESLCEETKDCDTDGGDDGDCTLEIYALNATVNDSYSNCVNSSDSELVIELQAFCDFEPIARRDLYLTGETCFLMSSIVDNSTSSPTMAPTTSNSTATPAPTAANATSDPTANPTSSPTTSSVSNYYAYFECDGGSFVTSIYLNDDECTDDNLVTSRYIDADQCSTWLYDEETGFGFDVTAEVTSCDDSGANIPFGMETVFLLLALLFVAALRE